MEAGINTVGGRQRGESKSSLHGLGTSYEAANRLSLERWSSELLLDYTTNSVPDFQFYEVHVPEEKQRDMTCVMIHAQVSSFAYHRWFGVRRCFIPSNAIIPQTLQHLSRIVFRLFNTHGIFKWAP